MRFLIITILSSILLLGSNALAKTEYYSCQAPDQKWSTVAKYNFSGFNRQEYIYKNNQFGYQFLFPKNWNGLKVFEVKDHVPDLGQITYHYFALPYKEKLQTKKCYESIFAVYAYTNEQWKKIKDEEGPINFFLGANNKYSFTLELAQSFGDESFEPYWNETLTTIAPTFKASDLQKTF